MISIICIEQSLPRFFRKNNLKKFSSAIVKEELKELGDLSFVFASDNYLLDLNKQFLEHDYYTDVITFDYSIKGTISGDVVISLDRVKDNADRHGAPLKQELHRVCFHGLLHLCGYKDKSQKDIKTMRAKEDYYLNKFVSRETNEDN